MDTRVQIVIVIALAVLIGVIILALIFKSSISVWIKKFGPFKFTTGKTKFELATDDYKISNRVEEKSVTEKEVLEQKDKNKIENEVPTTTEQGFDALFKAFYQDSPDKKEKVKVAYNKLQELEIDSKKKLENEVFYFYLYYSNFADKNAIDNLKRLSTYPDVAHEAFRYIGFCLEKVGQFDEALENHILGFENSKNEQDKVLSVINITNCLFELDRKPEAYKKIEEFFPKVSGEENISKLYEALAGLYEKDNKPEFRGLALMKALEYNPNSFDNLFSAAFSLSEANLNELSFVHYEIAKSFENNNPNVLNNLAIQYNELNMPIKSIATFKKANNLKYSLATANLAYRYMNAGFEEEAKSILEIARAEKEAHPNVGSATADLAEKKIKEDERYKEVETTGNKEKRFLNKFSQHYFIASDNSINWIVGKFVGLDLVAEVVIDNKHLEIIWSEGSQKNKILGEIHNNAAKIFHFKWMHYRYLNSSEGGFSSTYDRSGYLYFDNDDKTIFLMLLKDGQASPEFLTLKKQE